VSAHRAPPPRLERLLAAVLQYGTWLATAVIAIGMAMAPVDRRVGVPHPAALTPMRIATAGVALLILLPVLRVTLMLIVFVRQRDYRLGGVAALVLVFIVLGFTLGATM
jgi:uncharacterized membrane protein